MSSILENINDSFFDYIENNQNVEDITKLLLKKENLSFDKKFAIVQIECRKKAKNKLSELLQDRKFLFPKLFSAEQATHEIVAKFHGTLFSESDEVLDMTMGLGVDDYYISKVASNVTGIELDNDISNISKYNYLRIAKNIEVINADSCEYIQHCNKQFSAIFIDPARRDANNKRLFSFADCLPNVIELLPYIQANSDKLFIKASPMLDISQSIRELKHVSEIWIIAIKNSCKELLFKLDFKSSEARNNIIIHTINYDIHTQQLDFELDEESSNLDFCNPETNMYLLEPNSSILKAGMANNLPNKISNIKKIDINSHLFLSQDKVQNFPGRQFIINEIIPFKDKELKRLKRYKAMR